MQQPGQEIARFYPKKWMPSHKKKFSGLLFILIFLIIIELYFADNLIERLLVGICIILFGIIVIMESFYFRIEPIILFKNGITHYEPRLYKAIFKKRNFFYFNDIEEIIRYSSKENWIPIGIVLKNNKMYGSVVDNIKDFSLILKTFNEFKDQK